MLESTRTALACIVVGLVVTSVPSAQQWPQWRGPQRSAQAAGFDEPEQWPSGLTELWSVEVLPGLSSPVAQDGRVYLLLRDGNDEVVQCRSLADGRELWRSVYTAPFDANGGAVSPRRYPVSKGRGPFATPLLASGRLLTLGADRVLSSLAADDGTLKWRHRYLGAGDDGPVKYVCLPCGCADDGKEFDAPGVCPACGMGLSAKGSETAARSGGGNYYGAAASPLIHGELGVVHVGGPARGVLIAFDPISGEERWRSDGPIVGYSSPVVARIDGELQVIALTRTAVIGVDLETGTPRWSYEVPNNAHVVSPIAFEDLVIVALYQGPTLALRISHGEDGWTAERAWENTEMTQWLASPVLLDERLYGFFYSQKGRFAALEARTGKTLWASDGRQGESATLVATSHAIVALVDDGTLVVFERNPRAFRPLARYEVARSPTWTYPVLFDDKLLIRDEQRLTLWKLGSAPALPASTD